MIPSQTTRGASKQVLDDDIVGALQRCKELNRNDSALDIVSRVTTLIGLLDEGRAVAVAKNVKFDKSWPYPTRVVDLSGEMYSD